MKKHERFWDSDLWKWIKVLFELLLTAGIIVTITVILHDFGLAEDAEYPESYVICTPGDIVYVRASPSKKGSIIGMYEAGFRVQLDGKKKNGYMHCVNMSLEQTDGWIHSGFIVDNEPELINRKATVVSNGRLAARKYINGKRTRWLKPMAELIVYYWSDEWCVTNCGYVQSVFLELEGE